MGLFRKIFLVVNSLSFYIGWLWAIYFATRHRSWIAASVPAAVVVSHLLGQFRYMPSIFFHDLFLILFSLAIGFVVESLFISSGLVSYVTINSLSPYFPPIWLLLMYALYASTINHSYILSNRYPVLSSFFIAFGAPFSYFASHRLGALDFPRGPIPALIAIGIVWAFIHYAFVRLNAYVETKKQKVKSD